MCSEISLCRFQEKSISKQLHEQKGGTLWDEFRDQKENSQKTYFSFLSENIPFGHIFLKGIQKYQFSDSVKTGLANGCTKYWRKSWVEFTLHKAVSQKASFQVLSVDISFFTIALMSSQISFCSFHKNSNSKKLLKQKGGTLWNEFTYQK